MCSVTHHNQCYCISPEMLWRPFKLDNVHRQPWLLEQVSPDSSHHSPLSPYIKESSVLLECTSQCSPFTFDIKHAAESLSSNYTGNNEYTMNNVPLLKQHDLWKMTETKTQLPLFTRWPLKPDLKPIFKISKQVHAQPYSQRTSNWHSPCIRYPVVIMQMQLTFESWGKNSISQMQNETTSDIY